VQILEGLAPGTFKIGSAQTSFLKDARLSYAGMNSHINDSENPYFSSILGINSSNSEVDNSRKRANSKALGDLASAKASMGENLAQLSQTVDMFATIAEATTDLYRAYRALRRGQLPKIHGLNVKALKKLVKERKVERRLANYWLTYWYGFKPLVSDAYGIWDLMKELSKPALLVHGRGRSSVTYNKRFTSRVVGAFEPKLDLVDTCMIRHQCHVTGRLNDAHISRIINRAGLLNIPSLAWELIPFSFVVDWGVPVGTFLSNLTASSGLTFVGGCSTVISEREIIAEVSPQSLIGNQKANGAQRGFTMTRTKLTTWPSNEVFAKPFFTGASRFATIAALLSNLTKDL